jgi:NAD(P)-dependent dehydrogenase (short-subunit alcohol dehydrogenase family)
MNPIQTVLITGANAGLGREAARQLALRNGIEKIYLACRNLEKAEAAKTALEAQTGKSIFEIIVMDVSNPTSVRKAIASLSAPVDGVILNAGGTGGRSPNGLTDAGVTNIFASNLLGHVVLVDELLERQLITSTVLYAGSEAARGIPKMGVAKPDMKSQSAEEFVSIADGSKFPSDADPLDVYSYIKLVGAHWMGAMAREHPHVRFITMSPGGTTGTNGMDDLPFLKKVFFKYIGGTLMPIFGMMHSVETGAKRYVDGLLNEKFESGHFYASREGSPTGPVIDQAEIDNTFANPDFQDNANQAVHRFAA